MTNLSILLGMEQYMVIVTTVVILFVFMLIYSLFKRYKRCPSDKILVVYGKVGNKEGEKRTANCIHGGAAFIWPIIQDYEYLDLTPIPIVVDLRNALSKQNIRISVPSRFMVGVSTEPGAMDNAAERLLGLNLSQIHDLAADIIIGQLRVVIATMYIEEINSDREKFLTNVSDSVEHELRKIGLKLINVNVTDITDEAGYIEALGKEATSHAINEAKKVVAEKDRDGAIGEANARKEQRIQVANANSDAESGEAAATQRKRVQVANANSEAEMGEANANQRKRVQVANALAEAQIGESNAQQKQRTEMSKANASAVEGENIAKITIANSDAIRREQEAEAQKRATIAEKVSIAKALEESYSAEQTAETIRAERDKATQTANVVIPAQIFKQKIEIEAEAEAEKIRRTAKGQADATFFQMEAQAKGIFEILSKQSEGFTRLVQAAKENPQDAVMLMIADKLPDLVKLQVEAIKNIKIDKITVWDNLGGGKTGNTATAGFLSGMLGSLPPLEDIFKLAGMQLPEYLRSKGKIPEEKTIKTTAKTETDEKEK